MSPDQQTIVTETVEALLAEVFSVEAAGVPDTAILVDAEPAVDGAAGVDEEVESDWADPIDLTDDVVSLAPAAPEVNEADTVADKELIDHALRRTSNIVSEGRETSDELVDSAQSLALVIMNDAEDAADELIANARTEAAAIEEAADQLLVDAVAKARDDYQAKATEVTAQAAADAFLLVATAQEQVRDMFDRSLAKTERLIEASAFTIEDNEARSSETLATMTALAESRVAQAEKTAAAILKQARIDAALLQDQSEEEARDLLSSSRADADRMLTDAQAQADEIVASVEELKTRAHARLSEAAAEAAERGAASGRKEIEAQLIDTRREIEELEAQVIAKRQELAECERCSSSEAIAA